MRTAPGPARTPVLRVSASQFLRSRGVLLFLRLPPRTRTARRWTFPWAGTFGCWRVDPGWTAADIPDLTGKVFVITGGNSGLGYETALEVAGHGAQTLIASRNPAKTAEAVEKIRAAKPGARVEAMELDLSSLASIRAFSDALHRRLQKLDVLVNNAGVMAIPRRTTADGFEMQLGTNHLGHFALTGLLLDLLAASGAGRVVNVSSGVHRMGRMHFDDLQGEKHYGKWTAYGQSKLANLLFTAELEKRLRAANLPVIAVAAHPGYAATNLQTAGPKMENSRFMERGALWANAMFAQTAAQGALPILYAATAPNVKGNEYYGPDGFMQQWGYPRRVGRSKRARSESDAATLWDKSVALTGEGYARLGGQQAAT
jgi:NAD(P)-dependent dehydrogenase (short-subunit alcohol dehydrogenase family)